MIMTFPTNQCTRELLQEYYVNLARTHSSGKYKVEETSPALSHIHPPVSPSEGSGSRSTSPIVKDEAMMEEDQVQPLVIAEPSTVLMGKTIAPPLSPPAQTGPTPLEQNMAFAALQSDHSHMDSTSELRPEKRTGDHLVDSTDVAIRPVKRKPDLQPYH